MIHEEPSPLRGKVLHIKSEVAKLGGMAIRIEDWWDRLGQGSWMHCYGNPACMDYAIRTGLSKHSVPANNEVLYGHLQDGHGLGKLVHVSELEIPEWAAV